MKQNLPIVIVDDEANFLDSIELILRLAGFERIICLGDSRELLPLLASQEVGCVLLDLVMPRLSGQELLETIQQEFPHIPVIVMSGLNDIATVVRCVRLGAVDFLAKPLEKEHLLFVLRRLLETREQKDNYQRLKKSFLRGGLRNPQAFAAIISADPAMKKIFCYLEAVAESSEPVLISGETGVGKELIARAVHRLSGRRGRFVAVNIAGLDELVFADTLFGHEKGAFTDAARIRPGLIKEAAGGTLFMDEIGDLSEASQLKLLRLIQENEYYPLGSDQPSISTARIVAASNHDLEALISIKKFRADLYYRLAVHRVHIPPLRERPGDLPLLLDHFLEEAVLKIGKKKPQLPAGLVELLQNHSFPGNVRELRAMVFDAVSAGREDLLDVTIFQQAVNGQARKRPVGERPAGPETDIGISFSGFPSLETADSMLVEMALDRCRGNQAHAARLLGISRQALNARLLRKRAQKTSDG